MNNRFSDEKHFNATKLKDENYVMSIINGYTYKSSGALLRISSNKYMKMKMKII